MPFSALAQDFLDRPATALPSPPPLIDVSVLTDTVPADLAHISAEAVSCPALVLGIFALETRQNPRPPREAASSLKAVQNCAYAEGTTQDCGERK